MTDERGRWRWRGPSALLACDGSTRCRLLHRCARGACGCAQGCGPESAFFMSTDGAIVPPAGWKCFGVRAPAQLAAMIEVVPRGFFHA